MSTATSWMGCAKLIRPPHRCSRRCRSRKTDIAAPSIDMYRQRFGEHIPLIRRHDVKGFITRKPEWLVRPLGINVVRKQAEIMELETRQFYEKAQQRVTDASTRKLLGDLAEAERQHQAAAESLEQNLTTNVREQEEAASRRLFVLQIVQPGLAGLMDGSVSTLAPLFAAAFATQKSHDAFLVGLAASVGAGISMGFAEALSDDGSLTGRGHPWVRGVVCGLMTIGRAESDIPCRFSFRTSTLPFQRRWWW